MKNNNFDYQLALVQHFLKQKDKIKASEALKNLETDFPNYENFSRLKKDLNRLENTNKDMTLTWKSFAQLFGILFVLVVFFALFFNKPLYKPNPNWISESIFIAFMITLALSVLGFFIVFITKIIVNTNKLFINFIGKYSLKPSEITNFPDEGIWNPCGDNISKKYFDEKNKKVAQEIEKLKKSPYSIKNKLFLRSIPLLGGGYFNVYL